MSIPSHKMCCPPDALDVDKFFKKTKFLGTGRGQKASQLPTQEEPSGSSVGIGSMPGDIHEPGVATLPEERLNGRPYGTRHTGFEGKAIIFSYSLFLCKHLSVRKSKRTSNPKQQSSDSAAERQAYFSVQGAISSPIEVQIQIRDARN